VEGGFAFAEDDGSIGADALCAMGCEPGVLVFGKAFECGDVVQGCDDVG
jgi:hypothetical protein